MNAKLALLILLVVTTPCFAYVDPGIGGFLWQGFIAMMVGVVFQVLQFFRKKPGTHGSDSKTTAQSE